MVNVNEKYVAMPSNKHSGLRSRTQMLVVHSAESPLERGYAKSLTNWSNTSPNILSSWNTFVDPGVVVRAVNTYNAAWHASWANSLSVGYEQAAYAAYGRDKWMSPEGRRMLERLAIEMAADAEIFDIPLRWLTQAQVNAIRNGNTRIKGLASHAQVDPAYRTDPGDGFPYGYLLNRIKHHSGVKVKPAADNVQRLDWFDMADKNDLRDVLREFLGGESTDVPGNQPTGEGNSAWSLSNAITSIWGDTNAIRKELSDVRRLLNSLPDEILDAPVKLKGDFEGTTTLRTKIAWLAHEQHRVVDAAVANGESIAALPCNGCKVVLETREASHGESEATN